MTDAQLKQITDRLDLIKDILEETFKSMNKNNLGIQKQIKQASDDLQAMMLVTEKT